MLTAAAVKIAGGGLGNDACNILNEVRLVCLAPLATGHSHSRACVCLASLC